MSVGIGGFDWDEVRAPKNHDTRTADLRNRLTAVASDFQWRGLTVDVSVDEDVRLGLGVEASEAAVGAVRACLENVLQHSGESSAELILGADSGEVTIMVVDSGVGFDRHTVPVDRLGLRESVFRRVETASGAVRVWSAPGRGTSVVISLPRDGAGDD